MEASRKIRSYEWPAGAPRPALLFAPLIAILAIVIAYPMAQTAVLAFTNAKLMTGFSASKWIGFENFSYALTDPEFRFAFGRTLYFAFISVALEMVIGVAVALLLNQNFLGRSACRALLILPWALPTIVNALMWRLIYQPDFGVLNSVLGQIGIISSYRSWLGDDAVAMNAVIVADVWKNYPLVALIALAALQTVPKELYEAARIEGASAFKIFRYVTLPLVAGPILIAVILRVIEALKVFDIIYVMTRGGPANATKTVSFFVYEESFSFNRIGSGASYALILVLLSMVPVTIYLKLLKRTNA
jgi:multiple sugar transport system permease protein